jgi:broad specificity phosphatase PhoE
MFLSTLIRQRLIQQRRWGGCVYDHYHVIGDGRLSSFCTTSTSSTASGSSIPPVEQQQQLEEEDGGDSEVREFFVVRHGETDYNKELRIQGVTDIPLNEKGRLQAELLSHAIIRQILLSLSSDRRQQPMTPKPTISIPTTVQIYTSMMSRAVETGEAIFDRLVSDDTFNKSLIIKAPSCLERRSELNEWNLGALEGLRKEEATTVYPYDWKVFSKWADSYVCLEMRAHRIVGGGESMDDVRRRVVDFIESTVLQPEEEEDEGARNHPRALPPPTMNVFVSHGGVLGQLLRHVVSAQYIENPDLAKSRKEETAVVDAADSDDVAAVQQKVKTSSSSSYSRPQNACITKFTINKSSREWTIDTWADISHLVGDAAPIDTNYSREQ